MACQAVYLADCYVGQDEWNRVRVDAWFTCFCDRNFASGETYCARGETVFARPKAATGPIQNVRGKIVVIDRGVNTFFEKAQHAVEAGAVGVIFVNTDDDEPPPFVANAGERVQIPCVVVKRSWLTGRGARVGREMTITVATMGPSGTVDIEALAQGFRNVGQPFEDHAFPANLNSIFLDWRTPLPGYLKRKQAEKVFWKRPHELLDAPRLWVDCAVPNDIIQGQIGDCYFLAAAATLCPHNIRGLFVEERYFDEGLVAVQFFKNGEWLDVVIDTRIPCRDDEPEFVTRPVFVTRPQKKEFWMIMLEKAYAKLHGSYEMLDGGRMEDALQDMTGCPPASVGLADLFKDARNSDESLRKVKAMHLLQQTAHGRRLQGAQNEAGATEQAMGQGLLAGHAYSITSVHRTRSGEVLVCLRNPWGQGEWEGAWADNDTRRWTKELQKEMKFINAVDGTFFMSISDFANKFDTIAYVDLVPNSFSVYRTKGSWKGESAGGCWANNPQFVVTTKKPTDLTISLSQPDGKMAAVPSRVLHDTYEEYIGIDIFMGAQPLTQWNSTRLLRSAVYEAKRTISLNLALKPGGYVVVVSTYEPPSEMDFYMSFYSSQHIELTQL